MNDKTGVVVTFDLRVSIPPVRLADSAARVEQVMLTAGRMLATSSADPRFDDEVAMAKKER